MGRKEGGGRGVSFPVLSIHPSFSHHPPIHTPILIWFSSSDLSYVTIHGKCFPGRY